MGIIYKIFCMQSIIIKYFKYQNNQNPSILFSKYLNHNIQLECKFFETKDQLFSSSHFGLTHL